MELLRIQPERNLRIEFCHRAAGKHDVRTHVLAHSVQSPAQAAKSGALIGVGPQQGRQGFPAVRSSCHSQVSQQGNGFVQPDLYSAIVEVDARRTKQYYFELWHQYPSGWNK